MQGRNSRAIGTQSTPWLAGQHHCLAEHVAAQNHRMCGSFPNDDAAEPYPPPSLGRRLRRGPEILKLCVNREGGCVSHSVVAGWASYGRVYLGAFVPAAQHDCGMDDPVIGGGPAL